MPVTVTNTKVYIFSFPAGRLQIHAAPFMQTFRQLLIHYFISFYYILYYFSDTWQYYLKMLLKQLLFLQLRLIIYVKSLLVYTICF